MKTIEFKKKDKLDLIRRVSVMNLTKKENILFQKILEKGINEWNENDIPFLMLLYDLHHIPTLSVGGLDIYPYAQTEEIRRESNAKREIAKIKLTEEPFSLWIKNARNYS